VGEKPKKLRAISAERKPTAIDGVSGSGWIDLAEVRRRQENNGAELRHDSNMTTKETEVDLNECFSKELLIERQAHSCEFQETIEESQRRHFKRRAELMNELIMLEQGLVKDTLEKLLHYQLKRRDMPEWDDVVFELANSQEENNIQPGAKASLHEPKDAYESDEEIEDNDMINIMGQNEKPLSQGLPDDRSTLSNTAGSRRITDMTCIGNFSRRESEMSQIDEEAENLGEGEKEKQFGLFGIQVQDSEDDGENLLPNQPNLASSRFSFIDSNLDKFTVLQFMENQTLNITKVAGNQKSASKFAGS
jgi:hypothetical protein